MGKLSFNVGQRIRNYRVRQKLSQEELAEKCNLHPTYIGQVERGEKNATLESISKIAAGLGISLSKLFEHMDDCSDSGGENYPALAYSLVQSVPERMQEKLVTIIRTAIKMTE